MSSCSILLQPRPYAQSAGKLLLLPLLPSPTPLKPLPSEVWSEIVAYVLDEGPMPGTIESLLRICKSFTEIALPLIYANVEISRISALKKFQQRLHSSEQRWDSIRRIPYSTPGRWVQALNLSNLIPINQAETLEADSMLTQLFPLVPFLTRFSINPSFMLSRRAITSLAENDGAARIRALEGISYTYTLNTRMDNDPLVYLLRHCINLEELDVVCQSDLADIDVMSQETSAPSPESFLPLKLQKLHTVTLLSMHSSPLMMSLLLSQLPSLKKITLTPYNDIPYPAGLSTQFIALHGAKLRSLLLFTPKSWPTRLHPSPTTLLDMSPNLRHLSLENPLPALKFSGKHPLKILSIPRPNVEFWRMFEKLLPQLPNICVLRIRDVRWLRKGMNSRAQEAGVQGEMKEWRRRLNRNRIRLVDADWNENME